MNGQDRFESELRGWLREQAPRQAPDGLLGRGLGAVRETSQSRGWLTDMARLRSVQVGIAGVVVLAGVLAAMVLLDLTPRGVLPGASPRPEIVCPLDGGCREETAAVTLAVAKVQHRIVRIEFAASKICLADPFHPISCPVPLPPKGATDFIASAVVEFDGTPMRAYLNLFRSSEGTIVNLMRELVPPASPTPSTSPALIKPASLPGFATSNPPGPDAKWSTIKWRKLGTSDALAKVRTVVRWRGGYIAVGQDQNSDGNWWSPVWVSPDGGAWTPLDPWTFGTSTLVMTIAEVREGLIALTVHATSDQCQPVGDCLSLGPPVPTWTSPDGTSWTPHPGPDLLTATSPAREPRSTTVQIGMTSGPAGLVASGRQTTESVSSTRVAASRDGITWDLLPTDALPSGFALNQVIGTSGGYVAVGSISIDQDHFRAAALWSADGRAWAEASPLVIARADITLVATEPSSSVAHVVRGPDGMIAVGGVAGAPGATLWWQSSDGQHWTVLHDYPPLGHWPVEGEGATGQPYGELVGDGNRIVAIRGAADPRAWTSTDGLSWQPLHVSGDIPSEQATHATLLPGGVLLSDGTTTWYGEASAR